MLEAEVSGSVHLTASKSQERPFIVLATAAAPIRIPALSGISPPKFAGNVEAFEDARPHEHGRRAKRVLDDGLADDTMTPKRWRQFRVLVSRHQWPSPLRRRQAHRTFSSSEVQQSRAISPSRRRVVHDMPRRVDVTKQRQTTRHDREPSRSRPGPRKMQAQQIQETIVCCSSPSASTGSIAFHDTRTGAVLATFKQTNARVHCTDLVETKDGQGGFLLSAQQDKSILNVYNYQKVQLK